jgi:hypothetical protein
VTVQQFAPTWSARYDEVKVKKIRELGDVEKAIQSTVWQLYGEIDEWSKARIANTKGWIAKAAEALYMSRIENELKEMVNALARHDLSQLL